MLMYSIYCRRNLPFYCRDAIYRVCKNIEERYNFLICRAVTSWQPDSFSLKAIEKIDDQFRERVIINVFDLDFHSLAGRFRQC